MDLGLLYTGSLIVIEDFSDANWCLKLDECRSTEGFIVTKGGAAI